MHNLSRSILTGLALAALTGCDGFGAFGPGDGSGADYVPQPFVSPYNAFILKGDSVRFSTCDDYTKCGYGDTDVGNVLTRWSVPDSNVASFTNGTSAVLVPSATFAMVRGMGRGHVTLSAKFPSGNVWSQMVHVADSTDITAIELPMYLYSDTLRVNEIRTFGTQLRDVGGNVYRGRPALSVTDTTVLKLSWVGSINGAWTARIGAKRAGTANVEATFLGLTAKRTFTVVP